MSPPLPLFFPQLLLQTSLSPSMNGLPPPSHLPGPQLSRGLLDECSPLLQLPPLHTPRRTLSTAWATAVPPSVLKLRPWQRLGHEQVLSCRSCGCRWRGARCLVLTGTSGRRSQWGGTLNGRVGGSQGPAGSHRSHPGPGADAGPGPRPSLTAHSSVGFGSLGLSSCCKVWPPPATLTPSSSFLDARPLRPPLRCIKAVT